MASAFIWGLLATSSLMLGGIIAVRFTLSNHAIGIIMGFGAGTLISAISYELIFEAVKMRKGAGFPAIGLLVGAATFFSRINSLEFLALCQRLPGSFFLAVLHNDRFRLSRLLQGESS